MMKPVIRAIIEMLDELAEPEIIGEFIEPTPAVEPPKYKREPAKYRPPSPPSNSPSSPSAPPSTPPPEPSTNTTPPPEPSEQILQINTEVNANPQLRQLKQESKSTAWNCLGT
jgi:hypothetical protein